VAKDGLPVFGRILEPLGDKVWSAIGEKLGIESQSLNREDVIRDTVLRSSAILADPIYRRFLSLREAHALSSRPFEFIAFEEEMLTRSLNSLLDRRPALNRLLERVLSNTVESWVEISQAILLDRQTLSSDGLLYSSTMKIDRVTPGASDFHDGGRSATKVRFSSGQLLYLKSRDGGADIIWNQMLDEVSTSIGIALPKTHVVDFGSHHWIAEVQNTNRQDSLEFFYSQFGVLTFLVYLFQGIDFHCENIIATDIGPVIVDLEGLLHPTELPNRNWDAATSDAFHRLVTSVVNSGMLPCFIGGDGQAASIGAMNPPIKSKSERIVPTNVRTSAMDFESQQFVDYWTQHTPIHKGQDFDAQWIRSVLLGFQSAYRAYQAGGLDKAFISTIDSLRDTELRFILRPTPHYYNALHELLATIYEVPDLDEFSLLARHMKSLPTAFGIRDGLVDLEVEALAQFDIPRFTRLGGGLNVGNSDSESVVLNLLGNPVEESIQRYGELSTIDLGIQTSLLEASFGGLLESRPLDFSRCEILDRGDLLSLAVECGHTILASQVGNARHVAWLAATPVGDRGRTSFEVCNIDLYSGLSGIALFLGELYVATGESSFRLGATQCIETTRRRLGVERSYLGIGGGTGLGGVLYALSCLGLKLPDSSAADTASLICKMISTDEIALDQRFDIMDGAAGLLLGLISHRELDRQEDLEKACEDVILSGLLTSQRQGLRSWQTFEPGVCYSGMAHGSSGIAMALARRYALSPSPSTLEAIESALSFDFDNATGLDRGPFQWCHGAPGIALAHWSTAQSIPTQSKPLQSSIDEARSRTKVGLDNSTDGICCGSMGRVAALFHTAQTGDPDDQPWLSLVGAVSHGRQQRATFRWSAGVDALNPGLFVGVAGIGLELLRMSRDECGRTPLLFS
jgi:type 2 lantibiotic biosynthesis protein LanM